MGIPTYGEIPPTWLGELIKECRKIDRVLPSRERKAERECIASQIRKHPKGAQLVANGSFYAAIDDALDRAEQVEKELAKNADLMTGSPHEQAARVLVRKLNMESVLDAD